MTSPTQTTVPTAEYARTRAGAALDKAREVTEAMQADTMETDSTRARLLIDIAGEWRYLIDELV